MKVFSLHVFYCFVSTYRSFDKITNVLKHTQLLANHSSEHLLPSLQSVTPIKTECSDGGGGVKTGHNIAYK